MQSVIKNLLSEKDLTVKTEETNLKTNDTKNTTTTASNRPKFNILTDESNTNTNTLSHYKPSFTNIDSPTITYSIFDEPSISKFGGAQRFDFDLEANYNDHDFSVTCNTERSSSLEKD